MAIFGGYSAGIKPGMIVPCAGNTVQDGYLLCDGSAISRTLYPELFAAIGTTYGAGDGSTGAGDGSTTFNLPNFINRTFWGGATSGAYLDGTLPNIQAEYGYFSRTTMSQYLKGALYESSTQYPNRNIGSSSSASIGHAIFNASRSSSKYQDGALVRPESVQTRFCIKY